MEQQINTMEIQNFINKKENTITMMDRARIESQAKKDSLKIQYKEKTTNLNELIDKAKSLLDIEVELTDSNIQEVLVVEINKLIKELNEAIPDNL